MVISPLLGQQRFVREDATLTPKRVMRVALEWALHLPAAGIVIFEVLMRMVFLASYFAMVLLKLRTFLEHRAMKKSAHAPL